MPAVSHREHVHARELRGTDTAALDEEEYAELADFDVKDGGSEMPPRAWRDCLTILQKQEIVEKRRGTTETYRLAGED